ncbi:MAG: hypothetical protein HY648_00645 [Acidobacteria bacterium]|nr:hypothetical protein [Acidobacteriota bacterium]
MTPLTHAAVGAVIYQSFRTPRLRRWGWVLAFPLAFVSHHLLDAIPHFEGIGPLVGWRSRESFLIFLGFGLIGAGLAVYGIRRNREAGIVWLLLSLWIGTGGMPSLLFRVLASLASLACLAYWSRRAEALGCLAAGMLAVAPDFLPWTFARATEFHYRMHWKVDWATRLYLHFNPPPIPRDWQVRLTNPSFLFGYSLELLVEGMIFLGALYLLSRQRFPWNRPEDRSTEIQESVCVPEGN